MITPTQSNAQPRKILTIDSLRASSATVVPTNMAAFGPDAVSTNLLADNVNGTSSAGNSVKLTESLFDGLLGNLTGTAKSRGPIEPITPDEAAAMKASDFVALCICGPGKLVPRRLGDNDGVNPVIAVLNSAFRDCVSAPLDRASATSAQGMIFRVWLNSRADAKRLAHELPALLSRNGSALRGDWFDLGRNADFAALLRAIIDLAVAMGIRTYSDAQVLQLVRTAMSNPGAN